jgi:hypothetical protein
VPETTASDVSPTNFVGEVPADPAARSAALESARSEGEEAAPSDPEAALEIEVEPIDADPAPTGFQAFLQNANLHNLLQIESLSRTTGVFEVLSRGRIGFLHMAQGELIHAETDALVGEAAAFEILSWNQGELETSARPLAQTATIQTPLQALLLQLAQGQDEAVESVRRPPLVRSRPPEDEKPTEPHLPAPPVEGQARAGSSPPPPRSSRLPPPLPPRLERESANLAEVVLSPSGELLQSRGNAPDELAARVAYAARLAELIGRAIRSGAPRGLELRGKGTLTQVKWQQDGGIAASLELVQSPKMR